MVSVLSCHENQKALSLSQSQVKLRHSSFPANKNGGPSKQTVQGGKKLPGCGPPRRPGLGACVVLDELMACTHNYLVLGCAWTFWSHACAHVQLHVCREATCTMLWVEDGEEQRVWITVNDCCS
jgi:hypothetical protein